MSILRDIRVGAKLSGEQLSVKLGIQAVNVYKAEQRDNPTLAKIKEVARACGLKRVVIEVEG